MGALLLDSVHTLWSRWRDASLHTLNVIQHSAMLRRTLVALSITVLAGIVTTPLGKLHPLRPEGAGGLLIVTGLLAWLTMPICWRNGYAILHNGLRIIGMLCVIAGAAIVGSTRYRLPQAAALVTLLVGLIAGLVCLFALEEGAVHMNPHAQLPASLRLTEWLYGALFSGVFLLPFAAPHLLQDPLAYTILRFIPITLGTVTAWNLIEHVGQFPTASRAAVRRTGWIALATQAFFLISPKPVSLGWDGALLLVALQFGAIHLTQQHYLIAIADASQADATAQRRKLRAWKQRHEAASKDQAAWMALAAHDIKEPLHLMTLLSSQIAYIAEADPADAHIPEYARRLYSSCQRFGRFVNLFLDFAGQKVQAPINLRLSRVQPVALVRQVLADEQALNKTPMTLVLTPPEDLPGMRLDEEMTAYWDKARCEAVVVNLLSNAVKFSRNTPVTVRLWQPDADHIALDVADQGQGMCQDDLVRIFEPFYRAPDARETRGHGLGLTMAKAVVERHRGAIDARSAPGKGTLVRVTLPCEVRE